MQKVPAYVEENVILNQILVSAPLHTGHRDWFGCPGVTAAINSLFTDKGDLTAGSDDA